jgi:transcriptional regulator with XRE-family HTH domain
VSSGHSPGLNAILVFAESIAKIAIRYLLSAQSLEVMTVAYRTQEEVGTRIVQLRDERGLSQTELAQELELTAPVLCRIEKGERGLGAGEVIRVADFFSVSVDSILRDEEEPAFMLRSDVDNDDVRSTLAKFDRDIDTLLAVEATVR